jgi:hypothetical protein
MASKQIHRSVILFALAILVTLAALAAPACVSVSPTKPKGCEAGNCGTGGSTSSPATGGAHST